MDFEHLYAIELIEYLLGHPSGELASHLRYIVKTKAGPNFQPTWYATAKLFETVIGEGKGPTKSAAKKDAAKAGLQYLHEHGLPDPMEGRDSNPVLDLQNYLQSYPEYSLIPWFEWSVWETGAGDSRVHLASARFNNNEIGYGVGFSVEHAKHIAATQALERVNNNALPPLPHLLERPTHDLSDLLSDVLDTNYLYHPEGVHRHVYRCMNTTFSSC